MRSRYLKHCILKHKNWLFLIAVIILSINSNLTISSTYTTLKSDQNSYPSKITPFNFTTSVYWTPYMINNYDESTSQSYLFNNQLVVNGSFGTLMGERLPIYTTLFPMWPDDSSLHYSIHIESLQGPSNISLILNIRLYTQNAYFTSANATILNSSETSSVTGSVNLVGDINTYSYASIMNNISKNYAYSIVSLQPFSNNNSQKWNDNLGISVSLSGTEDREFFNYMRTQKGYQAWSTNDFKPLNLPKSIIYNNSTEEYFLNQNSQPVLTNQSPSELLLFDNSSSYGSKVLQMNLQIHTNQQLDMEFLLGRAFTVYEALNAGTNFIIYHLKIPLQKGVNNLQLLIPWQKMNKLNLTVQSFNSTFVRTSVFNQFGQNLTGYRIVNTVSINFESLQKGWYANATTLEQTQWLNNETLPDNTVNLTLNNKPYQIHYGNNMSYDLASLLHPTTVNNNLLHEANLIIIAGVTSIVLAGLIFTLIEYRKYKKEKKHLRQYKSFIQYFREKMRKEHTTTITNSNEQILKTLEEIIKENEKEEKLQ